jgi:acyl-CoA synthetase (AMP-forming)/AMP-acid ligase II
MHFNLADLFESVVDRVPDRTALVCGAQRRTYAQLEARANQCAHALVARGVGPGDVVGLYLLNGAEYMEAMIGCYKLRAVPVNVNFRYVEEELRYLLDDAEAVAVIHHRTFASRVASVRPSLAKLRVVLSVDDESAADLTAAGSEDFDSALAGASPVRDFPERSPDDLYVLYTGGTTGMPKGVMWRQEDVFFAGMMGGNPTIPHPTRPEEVSERVAAGAPNAGMTAAPLIHGAAQLGTWIALLQGWKACLVPRFDPQLVWKTVQDEKVLSLSIVGDAMARPLAEALDDAEYDLGSLFVMGSAGAVWTQAVKDQLKAKLPKLALLDSFGASETGAQGLDAGGVQAEGGIRFRMNAGSVVLDDADRAIEPGSGQVGRLAMRGRVPLGYWRDPAKTAKTFVTIDGVRHVLLGDLARPEADGTCTVFGRGSQCINSGGEKIFPEEVEGALKSHPDVFDAVVVGIPDAKWGEAVAAVIELRPGRRPALDDLIAHSRKHVAGYKAPRFVHVVDRMVRSPSGKPDYPWAKKTAGDAAAKSRGDTNA